nr:helix-turn-helix domain-containing protein [Pseudopedobacter sp.]
MNAFQQLHLLQLKEMLIKGRLVNQAEAARQLGCHPRTVRRLLKVLHQEGLKFHYSYQKRKYVYEKEH